MAHRDPRTFGRRRQRLNIDQRVCIAILVAGIACLIAMFGMTFVPGVKPGGPVLVGVLGFLLIAVAVLSFELDGR